MKLLSDWKIILKSAWSIRFGILAVIMGILETVCVMVPDISVGTPPGLMGGISSLFAAFGVLARILDQSLPLIEKAEQDIS